MTRIALAFLAGVLATLASLWLALRHTPDVLRREHRKAGLR